jgi:hypothetical protein
MMRSLAEAAAILKSDASPVVKLQVADQTLATLRRRQRLAKSADPRLSRAIAWVIGVRRKALENSHGTFDRAGNWHPLA